MNRFFLNTPDGCPGNPLLPSLLAILLGGLPGVVCGGTNELPLVPLPVAGHLNDGAAFEVTPTTVIVGHGEVAAQAQDALRRITGRTLKINDAIGRGSIVLRLDRELLSNLPDWQRAECYRLSAKASRVELSASTEHGLFNGVQTLAQLVSKSSKGKWQIPACEIEDYPRFPWRGLLVDPARHFLPPQFLKQFVDVMAFYKFNRLQLHLTDDQGWRLEIKKYPQLTAIGSIRK